MPQRALINESSDPTIVTCIPLRRALFCQVWHGGDGQSCMSSQRRWVDAVRVTFLSCLETYVEGHFTNSSLFLA